eukprot:GGOE01045826.1.p2 GENE.GGOE01045826.1~~GGOE01045826.1.p2  ORF type:complete len:219 (+),score=58.15 GGOE01045826.1:96-659(+)
MPRSKALAVGAFLTAGIHRAGDSMEKQIEAKYAQRIESTERCQSEKEMGTGKMQAAKAAYVASHGFAKVAGGAATAMDNIAEGIGAKTLGTQRPDSGLAHGLQAFVDVQEALSGRAVSAVSRAADCHVAYQLHAEGQQSADFARYIGKTAGNVTSGCFEAQNVAHPAKGLAKGVAKHAILGSDRRGQ